MQTELRLERKTVLRRRARNSLQYQLISCPHYMSGGGMLHTEYSLSNVKKYHTQYTFYMLSNVKSVLHGVHKTFLASGDITCGLEITRSIARAGRGPMVLWSMYSCAPDSSRSDLIVFHCFPRMIPICCGGTSRYLT